LRTPEGKVKDKVVKILKQYGVYYFFPVTGGFGMSGIPDIICCHNGRFIAIECKAGKNKTTALQDAHLARIRAAGGVAVVINEENVNGLAETIGCE
jgi:Holliday junction resolvase|tara:strand:+ start:1330 stop:1617 length:288 start_codon:yes stop_codon:yes gene_type:complete